MSKYYTDEKNVQVVISLLKEHGIRKIIASPGATNVTFVGSVMHDPYFEIYSSVDERSAAYMACGLAAESNEPIVLSCTGATASRNYLPGLTEAYYRKLPILAITSTQRLSRVGHHIAQVIDRSSLQNDVVKLSVHLPIINDEEDLWDCEIKVNRAILELKRRGGGPVHINLPTTYSDNFTVKELPKFRKIERITITDNFPKLPEGRVAIFIGSHRVFSEEETRAIDQFCESNDAVVFCDHTSSYKGKYRVNFTLAASQSRSPIVPFQPNLTIHIGEISGDYPGARVVGKTVWRISEDGEIRDTFRSLRYIFEIPELKFFQYYSDNTRLKPGNNSYYDQCNEYLSSIYKKIPELPFSNIWIASILADKIPEGSTIHFAILNSLRSWNLFQLPNSVNTSSNVGGFGIDGCISSLIGASLSNKERLFFGVFGDLAFFYDLNAIGNRHVGNNLRILVVNNGVGTEFKNYNHRAASFAEEADSYIAAAGHYGNQSKKLLKSYAENLNFKYLSAIDKEQFEQCYEDFISSDIKESSILFEVFTSSQDESRALELIENCYFTTEGNMKKVAKEILGEKGLNFIKKALK